MFWAFPAQPRDDQRESLDPAERAKQGSSVSRRVPWGGQANVDRLFWSPTLHKILVRKKKSLRCFCYSSMALAFARDWGSPGWHPPPLLQWEWSNTGAGCPGRMWSLHSWRHSKPNRTRSWVTCSSRTRWSPELLSTSVIVILHSYLRLLSSEDLHPVEERNDENFYFTQTRWILKIWCFYGKHMPVLDDSILG